MILIPCPKCNLTLGVRLEPHPEAAAVCRSCRQQIDYGHLIRAGLPSGLIARLMEWGSRSSEIIVGLGDELDDPSFATAWKSLHEETRTLLEGWRRFIDTDAGHAEEVFDQQMGASWTIDAIVDWRQQERRHRELSWFGYLIGSSSAATSRVVPYPPGAHSDADRDAFRMGFNTAIDFNSAANYPQSFGRELADLEAKYGRPCST